MPTIFFIVVHYGDPRVTQQLVAALRHEVVSRIVVVDHGALPLPSLVGAQVVRPRHNGGYGSGVNVGLGAVYGAGGAADDIVVVLNSDVRVGASLAHEVLAQQPGLAGLRLLGVRGGVVDGLSGRARLLPAVPRTWSGITWRHLPYIHGMCVIARLETFMRLRGMASDYFLYWEDVRLSWEVLRRGGQLIVQPHLSVWHDESFRDEDWRTYYRVRNGVAFLEHHGPVWWRPWWRAANRMRQIYHGQISGKAAVYRGLVDARRGRGGKAVATTL